MLSADQLPPQQLPEPQQLPAPQQSEPQSEPQPPHWQPSPEPQEQLSQAHSPPVQQAQAASQAVQHEGVLLAHVHDEQSQDTPQQQEAALINMDAMEENRTMGKLLGISRCLADRPY